MAIASSTIERLRSQHESILNLTKNVEEVLMRKRIEVDKWSIYENFVHLAVYQPRFVHRLNLILQGENPVFDPYLAQEDGLFNEYMQLPATEVCYRLQERRADLLNLIEKITDEDLNKMGTHARYGKMTLYEWIEFFLLHEAHHLFNIFMLKRQLH